MLSFRIRVPGVTEYTGSFPGQLQAALDAERRYPDAQPAHTFLLPQKAVGEVEARPENSPASARPAPEQHFSPGVDRRRAQHRRLGPTGLGVAKWGAAVAIAIILSASYLLDGPIQTQIVQDVAQDRQP